MIWIVSGPFGSGKTLLLASMALMAADAGVKVHANFELDSPNCDRITPYGFMQLLNSDRKENEELIVLHELYAWLSSHRTMSNSSELEAAVVFQSRKLNVSILGDCQITMRYDNSLRILADHRYQAENDVEKREFRYWELDTKQPNMDVQTGEFFTIPYDGFADQYWNRYRTWDKEKPLGMAKYLTEMERLEPSLMCATVDRQVQLIAAKIRASELPPKPSKLAVEYALIRLGEQPNFAAYVCEGLKLQSQQTGTLLQQNQNPNMALGAEVLNISPWLALKNRLHE